MPIVVTGRSELVPGIPGILGKFGSDLEGLRVFLGLLVATSAFAEVELVYELSTNLHGASGTRASEVFTRLVVLARRDGLARLAVTRASDVFTRHGSP